MNVISYCLFKKLINQSHRDWDLYRNEEERYWYNIPLMVLVNKLAYPDFTIKIYVSNNITSDYKFNLLLELEKLNLIKIIVVDVEYNSTQPSMFRLIPYFDTDTDYLLCRDIDSLPKIDEILQTYEFLKSKYVIHTMRSHRQHNAINTRMLAGLCGFNVKSCRNYGFLPYSDFSEYYSINSNDLWGCDQNALIRFFYLNIVDKKGLFLDSPLKTDIHNVLPFNDVAQLPSSGNIDDTILIEVDKLSIWAGEPIDSRTHTQRILNMCDIGKDILSIITSDSVLHEFFIK